MQSSVISGDESCKMSTYLGEAIEHLHLILRIAPTVARVEGCRHQLRADTSRQQAPDARAMDHLNCDPPVIITSTALRRADQA